MSEVKVLTKEEFLEENKKRLYREYRNYVNRMLKEGDYNPEILTKITNWDDFCFDEYMDYVELCD